MIECGRKPHMPVHTYEHANASKPDGEEVNLKAVRLSPYIRGVCRLTMCTDHGRRLSRQCSVSWEIKTLHVFAFGYVLANLACGLRQEWSVQKNKAVCLVFWVLHGLQFVCLCVDTFDAVYQSNVICLYLHSVH